jgi:hopene-associated glycosyltransferase HpnB
MGAPFHLQAAGIVGAAVLGIWLHLFFGRGWFWRIRSVDCGKIPALPEWPSVVAIVPARNEEETIGRAVTSLIHQDYPGRLNVIVVDDESEDATASLAAQVAADHRAEDRLRVERASARPQGWTGKLWALHAGVASSEREAPNFFWFTDADITHAPDTLRRLVAQAQQHNLDLTSLMVLLRAKTFPERALVPAFLYFFLMLYPPRWIADEDLRTAGAAGGCVLLKREALARIGGFEAIRGEVIDDCALAKAVKNSRGRVWMGTTRRSESLREYRTFAETRDLIARTAFTQLRYSSFLLAGTVLAMILTYVAPVALLFTHDFSACVLAAAAWLLMTISFAPAVRFYRLSLLWAPFLPLAATFYTYAACVSAVRFWLGHGGQWKGRAQASKGT